MAAPNSGRAALVAWTVVTSILFITATIFAIYFYVDADKVRGESAKKLSAYNEVVATSELSSQDVDDLKKLRNTEPFSGTAFNVLKEQRAQLARRLAGANATYETAVAGADEAVKTVAAKAKDAGLTVPPSDASLKGTIDSLMNDLVARQTALTKTKADFAAAQGSLKEQAASIEGIRTELNKSIEAVRAENTTAGEASSKSIAEKDTQIKAIQDDFEKKAAANQETVNQQQVTIAEMTKQLAALTKEKEGLQNRLSEKRVPVGTAISRTADGRISRVPTPGIVYIDLGRGDQIAPGLTFEVYDRIEGVPDTGDVGNDDNLPRGKGSIEVVQVNATTSECRIVKTQPGFTIAEGDLISNVVYDRNKKYNFFVYGKFDLDQSGAATDADAEIVKRLVGQWGAKLIDRVDVDTDFVVLGKEPVLPSFTKEELDDPVNKARIDSLREEQTRYQDVVNGAKALHIPVLNQNRFLYFVGYYELAKR